MNYNFVRFKIKTLKHLVMYSLSKKMNKPLNHKKRQKPDYEPFNLFLAKPSFLNFPLSFSMMAGPANKYSKQIL